MNNLVKIDKKSIPFVNTVNPLSLLGLLTISLSRKNSCGFAALFAVKLCFTGEPFSRDHAAIPPIQQSSGIAARVY